MIESLAGATAIAADIIFKRFAPSPTSFLAKTGIGLFRFFVVLDLGSRFAEFFVPRLEKRADRIGFAACSNKERVLQELKSRQTKIENLNDAIKSAERIRRLEK